MIQDTQQYRDKIATVDEAGKRIWIYPKKPKGWFTNARTYLSWVFLAILFGLPFIEYQGEPFMLFNILDRHFILFGVQYTPQDFHLFVLAMLTLMVFIVLFTVVYGRVFCGWACPQTVFMEMVFRKIEYWIEGDYNAQKRLDKAPWTTDKLLKKGAKHVLFVGVSALIAHTFLSYIIGLDNVVSIVSSSPMDNLGGFSAMVVFTAVFYGVFSRLREQVCTTICPYGRLQGVLTDKNTILVSYDFVRGEPRGKIQRKKPLNKTKTLVNDPIHDINAALKAAELNLPPIVEERPLELKGDCIDCKLCIKVCPTGIDIRDGVQLECINCTACMDACDEVMEKIGRAPQLIRYDSLNGIESKSKKIFTPRVAAYTAVLVLLVAVNALLLSTRTKIETVLLRTPGMLYQEVDETHISNLYNYQIFNKTNEVYNINFKLKEPIGRIKLVGDAPTVSKNKMAEGALFLELEKKHLNNGKNSITIQVYHDDTLMETIETNFLAPIQ